jgi:hypothetical protein
LVSKHGGSADNAGFEESVENLPPFTTFKKKMSLQEKYKI